VLLAPSVPHLDASLKDLEVILVRHARRPIGSSPHHALLLLFSMGLSSSKERWLLLESLEMRLSHLTLT
jgi:hypothetical protein